MDIKEKPLDVSSYFKIKKKNLNPEEVIPLFADKEHPGKSKSTFMVNYKIVFQLWATHVYNSPKPYLTARELSHIFPEYEHKIKLY